MTLPRHVLISQCWLNGLLTFPEPAIELQLCSSHKILLAVAADQEASHFMDNSGCATTRIAQESGECDISQQGQLSNE